MPPLPPINPAVPAPSATPRKTSCGLAPPSKPIPPANKAGLIPGAIAGANKLIPNCPTGLLTKFLAALKNTHRC